MLGIIALLCSIVSTLAVAIYHVYKFAVERRLEHIRLSDEATAEEQLEDALHDLEDVQHELEDVQDELHEERLHHPASDVDEEG